MAGLIWELGGVVAGPTVPSSPVCLRFESGDNVSVLLTIPEYILFRIIEMSGAPSSYRHAQSLLLDETNVPCRQSGGPHQNILLPGDNDNAFL